MGPPTTTPDATEAVRAWLELVDFGARCVMGEDGDTPIGWERYARVLDHENRERDEVWAAIARRTAVHGP